MKIHGVNNYFGEGETETGAVSLLPLRGPQEWVEGRAWSTKVPLGAAEYRRSWQVCTIWNVLLRHTCGEHTRQAWPLSSHWLISPWLTSGRTIWLWSTTARGQVWQVGSTNQWQAENFPASQAGLQSNKTHQWGVSQMLVSSHTVKGNCCKKLASTGKWFLAAPGDPNRVAFFGWPGRRDAPLFGQGATTGPSGPRMPSYLGTRWGALAPAGSSARDVSNLSGHPPTRSNCDVD